MSLIPAEDAELLQGVIDGRIDASEERVRALFRRRPELQGLEAACRGVERELDLTALAAEASEEDRRLVAESLSVARRSATGRRPRPRSLRALPGWAWIALAASVLLVLLLRARLTGDGTATDPGRMLGPRSKLECAAPVGVVPAFLTFTWTSEERLEPVGAYSLRVWARSADGTRGALLFEGTTRQKSLDVTPETSATWPEEILWSVEARNPSGSGSSCESSARRAP